MEIPASEWLSIIDDDGKEWVFDASFLMSRWTCIFGKGCKGTYGTAEHGCCSIGAHLSDEKEPQAIEIERINTAVGRMYDDEFRNPQVAKEIRRRWMVSNGKSFKTRILGDVCIFANDSTSLNGPGCSLHQAALKRDEPIHDWKPDVCTWAPLYEIQDTNNPDESNNESNMLTRFENRYWGSNYDGNILDWWCLDAKEAYVGDRPVYVAMQKEITSRIGKSMYGHLAAALDARIEMYGKGGEEVLIQIGRRDYGGSNPEWDYDDDEAPEDTASNEEEGS